MTIVNMQLGADSYQIHIGAGVLDNLSQFLPPGLSKRCMLVTDSNVESRYGDKVVSLLEDAGFRPIKVVVCPGEGSKTLDNAAALYDEAFSHGLDRRSPIFALGGGVVGDLAGFVAATYMRGVPFIQVPTTLLAQVDSSVGGKVAVNHPGGKNIIGSFYQPRVVVADTSLLATLPKRELRSGMAEVIKYGVIWDEQFFEFLEGNMSLAMELVPDVMEKVVSRCCEIKAQVVAADEREAGLRAILNFGHTVGHAIEALGRYQLKTHGEAVAVGMVMEASLALGIGTFCPHQLGRLASLLAKVSLDTQLPVEWQRQPAIELMKQDKKAVQGDIYFVLPETLGKVSLKKIPEYQLQRLLP